MIRSLRSVDQCVGLLPSKNVRSFDKLHVYLHESTTPTWRCKYVYLVLYVCLPGDECMLACDVYLPGDECMLTLQCMQCMYVTWRYM